MGRGRRRLSGRLVRGIALAWTIVLTGCSVHHYHHFDTTTGSPTAGLDSPPPLASAAGPATPPATPAGTSTSRAPQAAAVGDKSPGPSVTPIGYEPQASETGPAPPLTSTPLPAPNRLPKDTTGQVAPTSPIAPPTRLTLDQVINAVLVSDPKLRSGFEAINQANADALAASLKPNPTLYLDIQLLPLTRPFTPDMTGGPPQQDVNLSYPIDWYVFGKRAANMAAAAQGVKVSEADFSDQVRQRVTDAAVAFFDVLETEALLRLAREVVAILEQAEAALVKAVAAGGRPQVELNRIRLDLLVARQAVRDAETAVVSAKARLRAMIGRTDRDPAFDVDGSLDVPLNEEPPPPEEGFELAVRNRPDILSARLRIAQAQANVEVERRKAYPDLAPLLGYTRQYQTKAIGQPDANSWTAAVTMSLPVNNRNQGGRARAASVLTQFQFDYRAALADLRAEVETASQELRAARANAQAAAGDQLRLAREVLESVTTAFRAGGRPLVDLLDAQRNFRETYRSYASARAAYWRATFRYASVIGQQVHR